MARKAEWEKLKERSLKNFGEESIFGEGSLNSRLAIVGEAPGKHEVEEGRPFVGNAGKLLDELLKEAGIDRSKLYITNVVKIRPTKEGEGSTQNRPPRASEIREGIEVLKEELELERVMNLGENRIEMRIPRSAWFLAIYVSRIPKPFLIEFITASSQTPRPGAARQHAGEGHDKEVLHPQIRARHSIRHRVRDAGFSNLPSRIPAPP
jgi:hypothetical protein